MCAARGLLLSVAFLIVLQPELRGQVEPSGDWRLFARASISGSSHDSEPAGYTIYSGIAFDVAVARRLSDAFWVEFSVRPESREVEGPDVAGFGDHLGSLEMLPINLTLQWHPLGNNGASLQPYLGAGVNSTLTWEKSGVLDTTDPPTTLGPVVQLGTAWNVTPRAAVSMDAKWNPLEVEIEGYPPPEPRVEVDPLTLGIGVGLRF